VYKGELDHYEGHTMAAFKRLNPASEQGDQEFWNETKHKNVVSLQGIATNEVKGSLCMSMHVT
jgi:hypothetical protein